MQNDYLTTNAKQLAGFAKKWLQKILYLLLVLLALNSKSQAQAPGIEWQKALGGTDQDAAYSVQPTSDGGYVVAGNTASNNGDVTGHHGLRDLWVVKLNAAGGIQWQKALGGSLHDERAYIQLTPDGGYVVAGSTQSNNGDVSGNHGNVDIWVVKLDASGGIVWKKTLGGSGSEYTNSIETTADGGYIIAGQTTSSNGDAAGSGYVGSWDIWVVKLNAAGVIQWQKAFGTSSTDIANSVKQTADGGYVVAGSNASGDGDYWVLKLDPLGNIIWQKILGGNGGDVAQSVVTTADGGYVIAGYSNSTNGDVTGNHGNVDYWVVKLNALGNIVWQKSLGGTNQDIANSIITTADGGFVIAGQTASNNGDVSGNHGETDYWVLKLDASGNMVWQKPLGGSGNDIAYSIQPTSDAGYIVAGFTFSNDQDVSGNHGVIDFWVVKLGRDVIDTDGDGVADGDDNCPTKPNPMQTDTDSDGLGDACDLDDDGDGVDDSDDCAPLDITKWREGKFFPDSDNDGFGSGDGETLCYGEATPAGYSTNNTDNCPTKPNPMQTDTDSDGLGDACDLDDDGDGVDDSDDCAPLDITKWRESKFFPDSDNDGFGSGDGETLCYGEATPAGYSTNNTDNCPTKPNPMQTDTDSDGLGDACDLDDDGDGVDDGDDCAPLDITKWREGKFFPDSDNDGYGSGDGETLCYGEATPAGYSTNNTDNCPTKPNPMQTDTDSDGLGDACDLDDDGDGLDDGDDCAPLDITKWREGKFFPDSDNDGYGSGDGETLCYGEATPAGYSTNNTDNCPTKPNPLQTDTDGDSQGDACDLDDDGDGINDADDCAPLDKNKWREGKFFPDSDNDGYGSGDGVTLCYGEATPAGYSTNNTDNCPTKPNPLQTDTDGDSQGDACDLDDDGDGTSDAYDCEPLNQKNNKYLVCHKGETICVDKNAWENGHKKHGDNLGPCPGITSAKVSNVFVAMSREIEAEDLVSKLTVSNYPNPFTGATRIQYQLPTAGKVSLKVYDILGRPITTLVDGNKNAGTHNVNFDASKLSKGNYYYRIIVNTTEKQQVSKTGKMTLLK